MRADGSRSGKAQRVINPDLERKRCNRSDTGYGHQAAADRIVLNHLQKHPMQFGVSVEDRPAHGKHRLDHCRKDDIRALDQLAHETERPGESVAQVRRRHGVATSMVFRWRVDFGLSAQKAPQVVTVALSDGAANEPPALAVLRDLVQPPDGMIAIELDDGRRVFAPADSSPAAVKRQLAKREKTS